MADLSILDQSIPTIAEAIPSLSRENAEALLEAERDGKTRKGVIGPLEAHIASFDAKPEAEAPAVEGAEAAEEGDEAPEAQAEPEAAPRIADGDPPPGFENVENVVPGSDITLHDGSHLLFGESAHVPELLAWELRGRRQVK